MAKGNKSQQLPLSERTCRRCVHHRVCRLRYTIFHLMDGGEAFMVGYGKKADDLNKRTPISGSEFQDMLAKCCVEFLPTFFPPPGG